jgi:predicted AlkP superfamily phosphohydrolase/phosphomutase
MKTIVLGLDGVSKDTLAQLVANENLPNLKKIVNGGCFGTLESAIPPSTPASWSVAFTGKNPAKTGVYGYLKMKPDYSWEMIDADDRKSKDVWQIASEQGKKCIVMTLPFTFPPRKVNGAMVSYTLTKNVKGITSPKLLEDRLFDELGYIPPDQDAPNKDLIKSLKKTFDVSEKLMQEIDWDLAFIGIIHTEYANHNFFSKTRGTPKRYEENILEIYKVIDEELGKLFDNIKEEFNLFICSDHGHTSYPKTFHINSWLLANKYMYFTDKEKTDLVLREKKEKELNAIREKNKNKLKFAFLSGVHKLYFFTRNKAPWLKRFRVFIPEKIRTEMTISESRKVVSKAIDFSKTTAFPCPQSYGNVAGIYLNVDGKLNNGIVKKEAYEKKREEIIESFLKLRDPENGKPVVANAWKKEEVFSGPYLDEIADIIVKTNADYFPDCIYSEFITKKIIRKFNPITQHEMEGIIVAYGPQIKKEFKSDSNIVNLTPTILYSLGLSVPKELDGKAMTEFFVKDHVKKNPVSFSDYNTQYAASKKLRSKGVENKEKVRNALEDLGYI